MTPEDFRYLERLRVRWVEVDMQKIVFNGHYLMYLDTAVAGYWRALAMPYHETMDALGGDLYVRKATLEYLGSARYDESLRVGMRCQRVGNSSMLFVGAIFKGQQCLVHGELVYVFADPATQTSQPVPATLRQVLLDYEAGRDMLQLQVGDWQSVGAQARGLREAVFVQEQQVDAQLVFDEADHTAVHALATNRLDAVVGSGRMVRQPDGSFKLGRMASHPAVRGAGVGRAVLGALSAAARQAGAKSLLLHAQASAVGFYLGLGFIPEGPGFEEARIPHQAMRRVC